MSEITETTGPPAPTTYSPDGHWWWNGSQWLPVPPAPGHVQLQSVTVMPRKTNHTFHLLMTVFTLGLWSPIWFLVALLNSFSRDRQRTTYYRTP